MYFLLHAKQMQILEFAMLVTNFFYSSLKLFKGKNRAEQCCEWRNTFRRIEGKRGEQEVKRNKITEWSGSFYKR